MMKLSLSHIATRNWLAFFINRNHLNKRVRLFFLSLWTKNATKCKLLELSFLHIRKYNFLVILIFLRSAEDSGFASTNASIDETCINHLVNAKWMMTIVTFHVRHFYSKCGIVNFKYAISHLQYLTIAFWNSHLKESRRSRAEIAIQTIHNRQGHMASKCINLVPIMSVHCHLPW